MRTSSPKAPGASPAKPTQPPPTRDPLHQQLRSLSYDEGAQLLDPGRTPGFFSKAKAWLGLGGEQSQARAGSRTASEANKALMASPHGQRGARVAALLGMGIGNEKTFQQVVVELMGPAPDALAEAYAEAAKGHESLAAGLARTFSWSPWKHMYLRRIMARGEPDLVARLAMAAGLVTGTPAAQSEIMRLVENAGASELAAAFADPEGKRVVEQALAASKEYGGLFQDKARRAAAAIEAKKKEVAFEEAVAAHGSGHQLADAAWQALVHDKSEQLCAMYRQRWTLGRGLARTKLVADIQRMCGPWDPKLRRAVVASGQPLPTLLATEMKHWNAVTRTGPATVTHLLALVADGAEPPTEALPEGDVAPAPAPAGDAEVAADRAIVGPAGEGVLRDLERKKGSKTEIRHLKLGVFMSWTTLEDKIAAMSDAERQDFLLGHLNEAERDRLRDPDSDDAVAERYRQLALDRFEAQTLGPAGASGVDLARLRGAFAHGASREGHRAQSAYTRLRALALSKLPYADFGARALRYASKLEGAEILEVVRDRTLMTRLEERCGLTGRGSWRKLCELLAYTPPGASSGQAGAAGVRDDARRARRVGDGEVERGLAANMAELRPIHWTIKLTRELEKLRHTSHRHKVVMLVNDTIDAATRRAALPAEGRDERTAELPEAMGPMPATEFCRAVRRGLSEMASVAFESNPQLAAASTALWSATPVSALDQIEASTFELLSPKRLLGKGARHSTILDAIARAKGRQLLEQWSNYGQWRALHAEVTALRRQQERAAADKGLELKLADADARLRAFTLDVAPEVHAKLKKELPVDEHVASLAAIRERLAEAMRGDDAFKAQADAALDTGRFAQEKTRALGALDRQHVLDGGVQWSALSSASALRKEGRNVLVGRVRSGQHALDLGAATGKQAEARAQVDQTVAPKVGEAREDLERRTKTFEVVRDRANAVVSSVVALVVGAIMTAIATGTSIATFGGAAPVGAAMLFAAGAALGTGAVAASTERLLKGERFNAPAALSKAALAVLVAMATAGAGAGLVGVLPQGTDLASLVASEVVDAAVKSAVRTALKTPFQMATEVDTSQIPSHALAGLTGLLTDLAGAAASASTTAALDVPEATDPVAKGASTLPGKALDKAQGLAAKAGLKGAQKVYDRAVKPTYTVERAKGVPTVADSGEGERAAGDGARALKTMTAASRNVVGRGRALVDAHADMFSRGDIVALENAVLELDLSTKAAERRAGSERDPAALAALTKELGDERLELLGAIEAAEAQLRLARGLA